VTIVEQTSKLTKSKTWLIGNNTSNGNNDDEMMVKKVEWQKTVAVTWRLIDDRRDDDDIAGVIDSNEGDNNSSKLTTINGTSERWLMAGCVLFSIRFKWKLILVLIISSITNSSGRKHDTSPFNWANLIDDDITNSRPLVLTRLVKQLSRCLIGELVMIVVEQAWCLGLLVQWWWLANWPVTVMIIIGIVGTVNYWWWR